MKLLTGCLLEEGCNLLLEHQIYSHDQSLIGLQETHTEFGLSSSFKNCRNGDHVLPTVGNIHTYSRYLTGSDMEDMPPQKIIQQYSIIQINLNPHIHAIILLLDRTGQLTVLPLLDQHTSNLGRHKLSISTSESQDDPWLTNKRLWVSIGYIAFETEIHPRSSHT